MENFLFEGNSYKFINCLSWREVKGELVVINMASGEYHTYNSIGKMIWTSIANGEPFNDILKDIVDRYNVGFETASTDIYNFVHKLIQQGFLVKPSY